MKLHSLDQDFPLNRTECRPHLGSVNGHSWDDELGYGYKKETLNSKWAGKGKGWSSRGSPAPRPDITGISADPGTSSKPEWRKADLLKAGFRNTARFPQGLDRVKTFIIIIVGIIT